MNDKEFENVIALPAAGRYEYFIKRVADQEQLWSLWNDGWVLAGDAEGHEVAPVWPHERYASACAQGEWAGHTPRPIDLAGWIKNWLPGLERDGRLVGVFMTPSKSGVIISSERLRADLEAELSLYE